jgi:DNA-binding MurR/RpiR family transcriptional regulator
MASRIAQLTVIDCLFIGVAQRHLPTAMGALEATRDAVGPHRLETRPDGRRKTRETGK